MLFNLQGYNSFYEFLTNNEVLISNKGVHTKERCVHTGERCAHGRKLNTKVRVRYNFNVGGVIEMLSSVRN